ncbi:glycosyltransferase family 2 protein [Maioricimonas sp. JC845]|uniref:glycosyltransferase family 2 protein n=1 Tax=Maioricimonas sp. JC845 TaxID=3232138 RepID=UPI003458038A
MPILKDVTPARRTDTQAQSPGGARTGGAGPEGAPTACGGRPTPATELGVAVVIICHNQGEWLGDALGSVLAQTRQPAEIVIVDDASDDATAFELARRHADRVRYLRIEARHPWHARAAGLRATAAPLLIFLDADDLLAEDYIAAGLKAFTDRNVAGVYSDFVRFGRLHRRSRFPAEADARLLRRENVIHSATIVRRDALDVSEAFEGPVPDAQQPEDYFVWLKVADQGFRFVKQSSLLFYRAHIGRPSRSDLRVGSYYERHGLARQRVTIGIPLAGRKRLWPRMSRLLADQTWPHNQLQLILLDTSGNAAFRRDVRQWMAGCDYDDVRVITFQPDEPGLADQPRTSANARQVDRAMCRIYNWLRTAVDSPWLLVLEDDVFPPIDIVPRLMRSMDKHVGTVSAPYLSRQGDYVLWSAPGGGSAPGNRIRERGRGVEAITAAGFGCVLMRTELIRSHVFSQHPGETWFDPAFYIAAARAGWQHRVDWSCEAEHAAALQAGHSQ